MRIQIHNCHVHTFTLQHVPKNFLPLGLVRWLAKNNRTRKLAWLLNRLNPFSDDDLFNRYARFLRQGDQARQEDVLRNLEKAYPDDTRFVILSMDFTYMGAGKSPRNFIEQLEELALLRQKVGDRIVPFIAADPRRPDLLRLVRSYIEEHAFGGIKIYPPLGFFPFDKRLDPVYAYAEAEGIPVLTHCTRGGIYYRGNLSAQDRIHPITGARMKGRGNKSLSDYYSEPSNYHHVLEKFPNLKLCLGHFGGSGEWEKYLNILNPIVVEQTWFAVVKKLIRQYPNVYADISYTLADFALVHLLSVHLETAVVRNRILFGSDFYMSNLESTEFRWSVELRSRLGEERYKLIAETNPKRFLGE